VPFRPDRADGLLGSAPAHILVLGPSSLPPSAEALSATLWSHGQLLGRGAWHVQEVACGAGDLFVALAWFQVLVHDLVYAVVAGLVHRICG
jgi:hypothetical protein